MPSSRHDRALRRLVAELAEARPQDVKAVLDGLDEAGRRRVRGLLGGMLDGSADHDASLADDRQTLPGLSAWLGARLDPQGDGAGMTPLARTALQAAAAAVLLENATPAERRREAWIGRLGGGVP